MRSRQLRSLVVSLALVVTFSSFPASAAPHRDGEGWVDRDFPFIAKVIKNIRKTFGIASSADGLTLPTP